MRSLRSRDIRHERIGVITSDSGGLGGLKRQLYLEMQNILSLHYTDPYQANLASLGIDYSHLLARAILGIHREDSISSIFEIHF